MAQNWKEQDVYCGGHKGCGSDDVEYVGDQNDFSFEDYQMFKCNKCGKVIRIPLPESLKK